jgi:hypothetical protein
MNWEILLDVHTTCPNVFDLDLSLLILVDEEDLEAELEALGDEVAMEEEIKTDEGAIPRYLNSARGSQPSYLEGVSAPDGPIGDNKEGVNDNKLGETAT